MGLIKFFTILFLSLIMISLALFSQINLSYSSNNSITPTVAVNNNGLVLIVWVEDENNHFHLYYIIQKDGLWTPPRKVTITLGCASTPQLAVDPEGNFHLAYADGLSETSRDIFHSIYSDGKGWSAPQRIFTSPADSALQKIDIDSDGTIYIIWYQRHLDPYKSDIVMIYKKIGEQWPLAYTRITYTPSLETYYPGLKIKNGKVYVSYCEGIPGRWIIHYKEGITGSNWKNIPSVLLTDEGFYHPALEVNEKDNVHIVFNGRNGCVYYRSKINNIWKKREVFSNEITPIRFGGGGDIKLRNDVLVATWHQNTPFGVSVFYTMKILGKPWGSPIQVAEGIMALDPRIYIDKIYYAHFVWDDYIDGHIRDIFYKKESVRPSLPHIKLSKSFMSFTGEEGGNNPNPQNFFVWNIGEEILNYTINTDKQWLSVFPNSGNSSGENIEHSVNVDISALIEGTHFGTIEVKSAQADNSPQRIDVILNILAPPLYEPLNFTCQIKENRSLFLREKLHLLRWQANPLNRNIVKYRLYEIVGELRTFLSEMPNSTFEYLRRFIDKNKTYIYELVAVDHMSRISDAAVITVYPN